VVGRLTQPGFQASNQFLQRERAELALAALGVEVPERVLEVGEEEPLGVRLWVRLVDPLEDGRERNIAEQEEQALIEANEGALHRPGDRLPGALSMRRSHSRGRPPAVAAVGNSRVTWILLPPDAPPVGPRPPRHREDANTLDRAVCHFRLVGSWTSSNLRDCWCFRSSVLPSSQSCHTMRALGTRHIMRDPDNRPVVSWPEPPVHPSTPGAHGGNHRAIHPKSAGGLARLARPPT